MTLFFYSWFADFLLLRTQRLDCWNCFEISGSIVWCLALQWRTQVSVYMYPWNVYGYIPVCILCIIIALTCSIICLVIQECSWIYMYVLAEAFIYGNIFIWCPFFFIATCVFFSDLAKRVVWRSMWDCDQITAADLQRTPQIWVTVQCGSPWRHSRAGRSRSYCYIIETDSNSRSSSLSTLWGYKSGSYSLLAIWGHDDMGSKW